MNLKEYLEWHRSLGGDGSYTAGQSMADSKTWGFEGLGRFDIPELGDYKSKGDDEVWRDEKMEYLAVYDDKLTNWVKSTWPFLKFIAAKIQIQRPGEKVRPHLDFCGTYLESVVKQCPWLLKARHSWQDPSINIWRVCIAMEDHVDGQIFRFNNQDWIWKKGDCVRINTWRALHYTENKSDVDRPMIKITAIAPGKPHF
jgi:hypothetical protein